MLVIPIARCVPARHHRSVKSGGSGTDRGDAGLHPPGILNREESAWTSTE